MMGCIKYSDLKLEPVVARFATESESKEYVSSIDKAIETLSEGVSSNFEAISHVKNDLEDKILLESMNTSAELHSQHSELKRFRRNTIIIAIISAIFILVAAILIVTSEIRIQNRLNDLQNTAGYSSYIDVQEELDHEEE